MMPIITALNLELILIVLFPSLAVVIWAVLTLFVFKEKKQTIKHITQELPHLSEKDKDIILEMFQDHNKNK